MSDELLLFSGGVAFNPATDPSTLFFATAKSDVTTDAFGINEWGDPAFTTALQATDSRKPDEIPLFEGSPAVLCDGIAHRMDVGIATTPPFTITARCMVPSSLAAIGIVNPNFSGTSTLDVRRGSNTFPAPGFLIRLFSSTVFSESTSAMTLGTFFNYTILADTGTPFLKLFVDGVEESLSAQPAIAVPAGNSFRLGQDGVNFFPGYYRTLFVNNILLDPVAVNTYLNSEWP